MPFLTPEHQTNLPERIFLHTRVSRLHGTPRQGSVYSPGLTLEKHGNRLINRFAAESHLWFGLLLTPLEVVACALLALQVPAALTDHPNWHLMGPASDCRCHTASHFL